MGGGSHLGSTRHFEWKSESDVRTVLGLDWLIRSGIPYLEDAYELYRNNIIRAGDLRRVPASVTVRPSSSCTGGISGATGNGELSYCVGTWGDNQFCFGILAHELCNLFTGECISGGWPTEWWANHRSPFPTVAANEVMRSLVPQFYRMWGDYNDPLVGMFDNLFQNFPGMFPRMFQKMKELRVSLEGVSDSYLSNLVYYFMFYGAGSLNVANYFVSPPMPSVDPNLIKHFEQEFHLQVYR